MRISFTRIFAPTILISVAHASSDYTRPDFTYLAEEELGIPPEKIIENIIPSDEEKDIHEYFKKELSNPFYLRNRSEPVDSRPAPILENEFLEEIYRPEFVNKLFEPVTINESATCSNFFSGNPIPFISEDFEKRREHNYSDFISDYVKNNKTGRYMTFSEASLMEIQIGGDVLDKLKHDIDTDHEEEIYQHCLYKSITHDEPIDLNSENIKTVFGLPVNQDSINVWKTDGIYDLAFECSRIIADIDREDYFKHFDIPEYIPYNWNFYPAMGSKEYNYSFPSIDWKLLFEGKPNAVSPNQVKKSPELIKAQERKFNDYVFSIKIDGIEDHFVAQDTQDSCWAATLETAFRYLGFNYNQFQFMHALRVKCPLKRSDAATLTQILYAAESVRTAKSRIWEGSEEYYRDGDKNRQFDLAGGLYKVQDTKSLIIAAHRGYPIIAGIDIDGLKHTVLISGISFIPDGQYNEDLSLFLLYNLSKIVEVSYLDPSEDLGSITANWDDFLEKLEFMFFIVP